MSSASRRSCVFCLDNRCHGVNRPERGAANQCEILDPTRYEFWTSQPGAHVRSRSMPDYGKFCPVSMGADVIADRWTPLILRELILGSTRFNDIARGLPGISRSLLVQRLKHLERKGVLERWPSSTGRGSEYRLTPAGKDLENVVMALGEWSVNWLYNEMEPRDIDPITLTWWMHHRVDSQRAPARTRRRAVRLHGPGAGDDVDRARSRRSVRVPAASRLRQRRDRHVLRRRRCRACSAASSRGATPSPPSRSVSTVRRASPRRCRAGSWAVPFTQLVAEQEATAR